MSQVQEPGSAENTSILSFYFRPVSVSVAFFHSGVRQTRNCSGFPVSFRQANEYPWEMHLLKLPPSHPNFYGW